jgi:hypothetical protein
MPSGGPPEIPDRLGECDWTLSTERTETLFEGLGARVEGHTRTYEDTGLRERIVDAGGPDRTWRFFFVSALRISPSPPTRARSLIQPHVVRESRKRFASELRDRGFETIEHGDMRPFRIDDGIRARLTPYHGRLVLEETRVEIRGHVAVWYGDGFYVAGGAYTESGIEQWIDVDPDEFESELVALTRAVA